jgi:uncharacterized protein involved in exopolysaccharide biosynthesis
MAFEKRNQLGAVLPAAGNGLATIPSFETAGEYAPRLSLRALIEAGFRHPVRLVCAAGIPLLVAVVLLLVMPKRYLATMQLAVLNTRLYSVLSSDPSQPSKLYGNITDSDVNSQAQLLRSRDVFNQTLDQLGVPSSPAGARDRAIEALDHKLDVEPVRESNILNVSYIGSSPADAKNTLQALAASFVAKELSILRPTGGEKMFAGLVTQRQQELLKAQADFAQFKVDNGIASLKDDEATLLHQLEGLTSQSSSLSSELALEHQRAQRTDEELAKHPERITTQNRTTPHQAAIDTLTSLLVQLQNKRTSLLTGYQADDRIVRDIEEQIANTKTQLDQLRASDGLETTTDLNPLNTELKSQLARSQISGFALAAQRQSVEAQRRAFVGKLNLLETKAAQYDLLEKNVNEAKQNLDIALQKRDQAAVDDALDRDRILNVAFAAKPSASSLPVQPRPVLYLAVGLFMSLFFGVGVCVLTELSRKTVQSPAELDAITGVVTLAAVPLELEGPNGLRPYLGEEDVLRDSQPLTLSHEAQMQALQPVTARSKGL